MIRRVLNEFRDGWRTASADWLFWVVLAYGLILLIALASSAKAAEPFPVRDRWGNTYPKECQRDLRYLPAEIYRDQNLNVLFGPTSDGRRRAGYWLPPRNDGLHRIFIDRAFQDPQMQRDIIQHELCHALWYVLTGSPHWHKE